MTSHVQKLLALAERIVRLEQELERLHGTFRRLVAEGESSSVEPEATTRRVSTSIMTDALEKLSAQNPLIAYDVKQVLQAAEIEATFAEVEHARVILSKLVRHGRVERVARGLYRLKPAPAAESKPT